MSAHFETHGVTVVTDPKPTMIYDFGGFDPQLYRMVYPAPGEPQLAERVVALLDEAGLAPARLGRRGYDHGTWTPLKLAYPADDIPVVQISIDPNRDARWHHAVGRALAPLRAEVEANLRKIDDMINELQRKWPFSKPRKVELP